MISDKAEKRSISLRGRTKYLWVILGAASFGAVLFFAGRVAVESVLIHFGIDDPKELSPFGGMVVIYGGDILGSILAGVGAFAVGWRLWPINRVTRMGGADG